MGRGKREMCLHIRVGFGSHPDTISDSLAGMLLRCLCSASLGFIYLFIYQTLRNQALLNNSGNYHNVNKALAPSSTSSVHFCTLLIASATTSPNPHLVLCLVTATVAPNSSCESFRH